jgi:O-phosphoseryl-tRNA(Cys) synthetase
VGIFSMKKYKNLKIEEEVFFEFKRMKKMAELQNFKNRITDTKFLAQLLLNRGKKPFKIEGVELQKIYEK